MLSLSLSLSLCNTHACIPSGDRMFCVYVYIYITVQGQAVSRIYVHIHTMGCQMLALGLTSLHALFRGQVGNLIARPILALFLLGLTLPHLIGKEAYLVD